MTTTKVRKIERKSRATKDVTVRLHGYPAYNRPLSGYHPGWWMVDFQFQGEGALRTFTYFESEDYEEAYRKYEMIKVVLDK